MNVHFLGAARTVTGSCYLVQHADLRILIDCGFTQGRNSQDQNRRPFLFNAAELDMVFLTHAHLDHSGLLPRLARAGFSGPIVATGATTDLAGPLLHDSARIQEADAEALTRKALRTGGWPVEPLYRSEDVERALSLFRKVPCGSIQQGQRGLRYRFLDAGHILGSGTLELWFSSSGRDRKIVFSGDIGKKGSPIINDPDPAEEADYVVMESTYGNRLHKPAPDSIDELAQAVRDTFERKGNVLIPAFAVGRTQDLLYLLNGLARDGRIPRTTVHIDSPLAERVTKAYLSHPECYDDEAKRLLSGGSMGDAVTVKFTHSVEESRALNNVKSRAVIIAGSGMCDAGRIRHHLRHNLGRPECSVIFAGFQAEGTLGRRIVDGAKRVGINGDDIAVNARIHTINGFSAHADRGELLDWLSAYRGNPTVFVTHGEEQAAFAFAEGVRSRFGFTTHVPARGDVHEL